MYETQIASVIANKGWIKATSADPSKAGKISATIHHSSIVDRIVTASWPAKMQVTPVGINLIANSNGGIGDDSVVISNEADNSSIGQINDKGFIFSDNFSGCLFFLFRDNYGGVYGSHSVRQSGKFANPVPYFDKLHGKLLYVFSTAGHFSSLGPNVTGSVLCNVDTNTITIDFLAVNDGNIIKAIDHKVITNWRTAPGIKGLAGMKGAMDAAVDPVVQSPKQSGLRARIAQSIIRYI